MASRKNHKAKPKDGLTKTIQLHKIDPMVGNKDTNAKENT